MPIPAKLRTTTVAPFGEVVRSTGPLARNNPFRFSTKYQDDESDLLYYGYRYYNASTGRWPNRDPLEEEGGINLYDYVKNKSVNSFDPVGLDGNDGSPSSVEPFNLRTDTAGPDITAVLQRTLDKVQLDWDANPGNHCKACEQLKSFAALGSWDIKQLSDLGMYGDPFPDTKVNGTGNWARTVQFSYNGGPPKVYWAGAVNYVIWGKMHALCAKEFTIFLTPGEPYPLGMLSSADFTLDQALMLVHARKDAPRPLGFGGDQDADASAFTEYGFNGSSPESVALQPGYSFDLNTGQLVYSTANPNNVFPSVPTKPPYVMAYHWEGINAGNGTQH